MFCCFNEYFFSNAYVKFMQWNDGHSALEEKRKRKKRWLWCCDQLELWCCFIFELVNIKCIPEMGNTRIGGSVKTTSSILRWTLWTGVDELACDKPLGSHKVGWKHLVQPGTSTMMVGWTIKWQGAPEIKCHEGHPSECYSGFRRHSLRVPLGSRLRPWV